MDSSNLRVGDLVLGMLSVNLDLETTLRHVGALQEGLFVQYTCQKYGYAAIVSANK